MYANYGGQVYHVKIEENKRQCRCLTPSKNCMAMIWFYILLIDYGKQVYCWKMTENILQCMCISVSVYQCIIQHWMTEWLNDWMTENILQCMCISVSVYHSALMITNKHHLILIQNSCYSWTWVSHSSFTFHVFGMKASSNHYQCLMLVDTVEIVIYADIKSPNQLQKIFQLRQWQTMANYSINISLAGFLGFSSKLHWIGIFSPLEILLGNIANPA